MRTTVFKSGEQVPALGQGTWHLGEGEHDRRQEVAALREGIQLGTTLIDTAECTEVEQISLPIRRKTHTDGQQYGGGFHSPGS